MAKWHSHGLEEGPGFLCPLTREPGPRAPAQAPTPAWPWDTGPLRGPAQALQGLGLTQPCEAGSREADSTALTGCRLPRGSRVLEASPGEIGWAPHPGRLRFSLDASLPSRCREPSWRALGPLRVGRRALVPAGAGNRSPGRGRRWP